MTFATSEQVGVVEGRERGECVIVFLLLKRQLSFRIVRRHGIMKNRFRTEAAKYRGLENSGPLENKTSAPLASHYGTGMTEARQ